MEVIEAVVDIEVVILWDQEDADLVVANEAEVHSRQDQLTLIRLHVTGAGCVAIWPVTVPNLVQHSQREVAMLALPEEDSLNPGKKAHEIEDVDGQFGSEASTSYMTRLGMNSQWMMQVSCTSPSDSNLL